MNILGAKDRIVDGVRKSRELRGIIRKINPKIADLAFPRDGKAKIAKCRLKLGSERSGKSRSAGPRNNNRRMRRRIELAYPFGKGRLRKFPRGIRVRIRVKPLNKILDRLGPEFTFR